MTRRPILLASVYLALASVVSLHAQSGGNGERQRIRTVSIPISIFTKQELKQGQTEEFVQVDRLIVNENKTEQQILSIRSVADVPLSLAILIQEDLTSEFNLQRQDLARFIRSLPRGSRVLVAYLRGGTIQVKQRFTDDLERAANSLRIVTSNVSAAPNSPFEGVTEALNRFDALPAGRRAVLLVSDGLDLGRGNVSLADLDSPELDRAILRAQRRNVAVFSFYHPATLTEGGDSRRVLIGQSALARISDQTGGRAFFQGSLAPVSLQPFFRDLSMLLNRQFLLTYLSTNMKKGYYRVEVSSTNPEVKVEHPKGYYYR